VCLAGNFINSEWHRVEVILFLHPPPLLKKCQFKIRGKSGKGVNTYDHDLFELQVMVFARHTPVSTHLPVSDFMVNCCAPWLSNIRSICIDVPHGVIQLIAVLSQMPCIVHVEISRFYNDEGRKGTASPSFFAIGQSRWTDYSPPSLTPNIYDILQICFYRMGPICDRRISSKPSTISR